MALSPEEIARRDGFDQTYVRSQCPAILSIERRVCGCDYGGYSCTTRDEARQMAKLLGLQSGTRLLDVGAGAGWPGLYIAKETGCEVMLVDLPLKGLQIATERAAKDRISDRCWVAAADGSEMPFRDRSFDAVSHSDILCCLRDKRGVLEACRRVISDSGRMVFTVIWITPGLSHDDYGRALEAAPEFGEVEADYPTLLGQTGWTVTDSTNVTEGYASWTHRQIQADREFKNELEALLGVTEFADRLADWRSQLDAIEEGLLRRDLFMAIPTLD
jgi:cyclopropane fatty-acyl-phospholipid synthase-like methyltransferase